MVLLANVPITAPEKDLALTKLENVCASGVLNINFRGYINDDCSEKVSEENM
jgi:hypothetical protein